MAIDGKDLLLLNALNKGKGVGSLGSGNVLSTLALAGLLGNDGGDLIDLMAKINCAGGDCDLLALKTVLE